MPSLFYTRTNIITHETPGFVELSDSDTNKKVIANGLKENIPGVSVVESGSIQYDLTDEIDQNEVKIDAIQAKLPAGLVASQIDVQSIQNNTRFVSSVPVYLLIPETGDNAFEVRAYFYDTEGNMEDPDINEFSINLQTVDGTSKNTILYKESTLTTQLDASTNFVTHRKMERLDVGIYNFYVKIADAEDETQFMYDFACKENTISLHFTRTSLVITSSPGFTGLADTDANKKVIANAVRENVPGMSAVASGSVQQDIVDEIDINENKINNIEVKLPVAGLIASQLDVQSIQNNTRFVSSIPVYFLVPEIDNNVYKIKVHFYDTNGSMEDPDDSEFSIDVETADGTDKNPILYKDFACSNPLDNSTKFTGYKEMERENVGIFFFYIKVNYTEVEAQFVYDFACEEQSIPLHYSRSNLLLLDAPGFSELADTDANKRVIADSIRENIPGMATVEDGSIQDELVDEINENEAKIDSLQTDMGTVTDKLPEGDIADGDDLTKVLENTATIKFTRP